MKKQTFQHFAVTSALLGLLLSASLSQTQGKFPSRPMSHHPSSATSPTLVQQAQPAGSSYTYTLLDFPGTFYTFPEALNVDSSSSKVEIVGGYGQGAYLTTDSFLVHVTESKKGITTESYQTVNFPSVPLQSADGVNKGGQIVGQYVDTSGVFHGWELSGGTFTTIDVPFSGATGTFLGGINDSGEIVGGWDQSGAPQNQHGFTLISGTYTSFDYPGALQTVAFAVNNKGDIVGYWVDTSGEEHGFLLSGGTYTSIDPPGSIWTYASGINDAGDIVGGFCTTVACYDSDGYNGGQGFLLSKGTYTMFTIPGESGTGLSAINDKGWILGSYDDAAGFVYGFIAVP